jgi:site-specific DNA-methyltransferase (adenine-specific)
MPVFFYGIQQTLQNGAQQTVLKSVDTAEVNGHPCPKPEGWMRWLVNLATLSTDTVIDPFAGSGTTLVAAKRMGRKAIGIELNERYCEIAATRLQQEALPLEVG